MIRDSGVYVIRRVGTDQCYIGSSQNTVERWYRHRRNLRLGEHPSSHLQNAWNKYGEQAFEFSVLEPCEVGALLSREQYFIDTLRPIFNKALFAGSPMRGRKHSAEWKTQASDRMRGNKHAAGLVHTAEWRAAATARLTGRTHAGGWKHSAEAKARIAAAMVGKRHALGSKPSPETLAKRAAGIKAAYARNPRTISVETRAKISKTLSGKTRSLGRLEHKFPLLTGSV